MAISLTQDTQTSQESCCGEAAKGTEADAKREARSGGQERSAVAAKPQKARRPTLSAKRVAAAKIGTRVPKGRGRNEPTARRKARRRRPTEKVGWGRKAATARRGARNGRGAAQARQQRQQGGFVGSEEGREGRCCGKCILSKS